MQISLEGLKSTFEYAEGSENLTDRLRLSNLRIRNKIEMKKQKPVQHHRACQHEHMVLQKKREWKAEKMSFFLNYILLIMLLRLS